ncbi:MAG: hypothetical protein K0S23_1846 [Fluviicola sp.]|jgi:hypothetical protein|uniref:hypothetical protein n=1 Tax=Fluviicola sp. TaxID=1917219 RepID=UPI0026066757|nr:hypothetical protein [Fluviicola sp.]MDF3027539.1 hypothetical protein [Fluviicola sp.]
MKVLKRILLTFLVVLVLAALGGYIYFDQKFTPDKNYLTVENESGSIPLTWFGVEKNALLLPIHFERDTTNYYLQFDTGSPYTVFYSKSIKSIPQISITKGVAKASFYIGKTKISSDTFKIYNSGDDTDTNSLKIIGTIGTDILENRRTIINFKENYLALNLSKVPTQFKPNLFYFEFKKRKIILAGILKGEEESFLYDSGTSAYELLSNKEVWEELKLPHSKITIEKSQSWENVLTTFTANCKQKIIFNKQEVPLNHVTYVEGFSQIQYLMMKFSGMTGMLGNKLFLNHSLYIDCIQNKMGIE